MKQRSKRGAARVGAIWLIFAIVLFLVALFFAYDANKAASMAQEAEVTAKAATVVAEKRNGELLTELLDLSRVVGYYNREDMSSRSDIDAAKKGLQDFKDAFATAGMGASTTTFENAWPLAAQAWRDENTKLRAATSTVTDLRNELAGQKTAVASVTSTKDAVIAKAGSDLQDAQSAADTERGSLEGTIASLRQNVNDIDSESKQKESQIDALNREKEAAAQEATTRMAILTEQLKFIKEPPGPDGAILDTSQALGIAFIDRGAKDRVTRGMGFLVESGNPASSRIKGRVVVTEVYEGMSKVAITELADQYDPIVQGDLISNPLYDAAGGRNAVLAGRFSGTWNEKELQLLLEDIGIHVQPKLDKATTYLIVGEPLFVDPETDELKEDPIPVSDLSIYKDAQAQGVHIVHISDIRQFFKK
jgi:hypothetical protein